MIRPLLPLVAIFAALPAIAQPASQSPLVGAWQLVDAVSVREDGSVHPLMMLGGRGLTGTIIYGADGWMSVQMAGASRPHVAADDPRRRDHPPERGAAIANSYYAYYGRYSVDPAEGMVRHYVTQALHPDEVGRTYERRFSMNGDTLTLTTPNSTFNGITGHNRLVWRRMPGGAPSSSQKQ